MAEGLEIFGFALTAAELLMEAMTAALVSLELQKQDGQYGGQSNLQPVTNISLCHSERMTARKLLADAHRYFP